MKKIHLSRLKKHWRWQYLLGLALVIALGVILFMARPSSSPSNKAPETQPEKNKSSHQTNKPAAEPKSYDYADSLEVVVNKGRALPSSYAPSHFGGYGLRQEAGTALGKLFAAAKNDRLAMKLTSGYRSYSSQQTVYNDYVRSYGQTQADTFSARPGHSEHQTGLAADVEPSDGRCSLDTCFGDTAEGKWLVANAYRYGFIIRYKKGQESLSGYQYEPWHIRYVGTKIATSLQNSGKTLEQYFGLPAYTSYPAKPYELKI